MSTVTLLGPQRRRPTAPACVREVAAGPVAIVTAGWQERENDPLPRGIASKGTNLGIYRRAERVFDRDRELFQAHRERQLALKQLQRLYRVRLDHALAAYRDLLDLPAEGPLVDSERGEALASLRALDRHHLEQVRAIHEEFEVAWQPSARTAVARERTELEAELEAVETVILAGGHVAVLLNRLRLFDLAPLLAGKTIIAWSAGAMVASGYVVLFHDNPPWGAGNAEMLDVGLGLFPGVLPFPDTRRRLRSSDPRRIVQLARRFGPLVCIGLDETSRLRRDEDGSWRGHRAQRFAGDGAVNKIGHSGWEEVAP